MVSRRQRRRALRHRLATIGVYGYPRRLASNNKFSLMGGRRSAAQMISSRCRGLPSRCLILAGTCRWSGSWRRSGTWGLVRFHPARRLSYTWLRAGESNRNPSTARGRSSWWPASTPVQRHALRPVLPGRVREQIGSRP